MKLTRARKIALAVATAWAPTYLVLFFCVLVFTFLGFPTGLRSNTGSKAMPPALLVIFPLHFFTMLLGIVILVVYLLHALQNEKFDQNTRLLWAILLAVGGLVTMPIYFYKYVLPLSDDPP